MAVDAFNNMQSPTNPNGYPESASPLLTLLNPNGVRIFDVKSDAGWYSGLPKAAVHQLYTLAGSTFNPHLDGNFNPVTPDTSQASKVTGLAQWQDYPDGTIIGIRYTFTYQNNYLTVLHAR
jgi:hypothetical protein